MKTLLCAAGAFSLLAGAALAAPSPFDGTWRTDMSSINFPKKPDVIVVKNGEMTCSTCTPPYTVKADGAFHPVSGHPDFDAKMVRIVDARTVDETNRKGGRDVGFSHAVVSADGKTLAVDWKDMTNAGAPVATGHVVLTRVSAAPAGAHATSGGFVGAKAEASADATTWTMKLENGVLTYSNLTGQGYSAKVGGPAAPYRGDPTITSVKVASGGAHELVETDYHGGKAVGVLHMTASPDGRTLMLSGENLKNGRKSSAKANRV